MIKQSRWLHVLFLARIVFSLRAGNAPVSKETVKNVASSILEMTTVEDELILLQDSVAELDRVLSASRSTSVVSAVVPWDETDPYLVQSQEIDRIERRIRERILASEKKLVLINHSVPSSVIDSIFIKILGDCCGCSKPELLQLSLVTEPIPTIPTHIYTRGLIFLPESFLPTPESRILSLGDPLKAVETVAERVADALEPFEKLVFIEASLKRVHDVIGEPLSAMLMETSPTDLTFSRKMDQLINEMRAQAETSSILIVNHEIPPAVIDQLYSRLIKTCSMCSSKVFLLQLVPGRGNIPALANRIPIRGLIFLPEAFLGKSRGEFPDSLPTFRNTRYGGTNQLADHSSARIMAGKVNAHWAEKQMKLLTPSASNTFIMNGLTSMVVDEVLSIPCGNTCEEFGQWMDLSMFAYYNEDWLFIHHIHEIRRIVEYLQTPCMGAKKALSDSRALFRSEIGPWGRATENILPTVLSVSKQIVHATSSDDLVVFVGNSPSYFYHLVEKVRDSVALPFSSSRFNLDEFDFQRDTFPGLHHYVDVFLRPIFDKKKPILLVDMSVTGQTINILGRLMRSRCPDCKIEFLQLFVRNPEVFSLPESPREVYTRQIIFIPEICHNFLTGQYDRLMPKLSREHWSKASQALVHAYKAQPVQAEIIKKIQALSRLAAFKEPMPAEPESPVINLGLYAQLTTEDSEYSTSWLQPDLSIPLIRVTDWLKETLEEYSITLDSEVITREDVDQMARAQSSRGESVEKIANRLIMMCDFTHTRGWFAKWGPQLMELIRSHEFVRDELGPIATQIARNILVTADARSRFGRLLNLIDSNN